MTPWSAPRSRELCTAPHRRRRLVLFLPLSFTLKCTKQSLSPACCGYTRTSHVVGPRWIVMIWPKSLTAACTMRVFLSRLLLSTPHTASFDLARQKPLPRLRSFLKFRNFTIRSVAGCLGARSFACGARSVGSACVRHCFHHLSLCCTRACIALRGHGHGCGDQSIKCMRGSSFLQEDKGSKGVCVRARTRALSTCSNAAKAVSATSMIH
jgi:hypothetical protein